MLRALKRSLAAFLDTRGYAVIPHWQLSRYPATRYLQRLFGMLNMDCVLDVGANAGQYRNYLRNEVGYSGLIVSFEPTPHLVEDLKRRAADDPLWKVEGIALGSQSGTAKFNTMHGSEFNSFLPPDHSHIGLFRDQNAVAQTIDVEVRTLDSLLPELLQRHPVKNIYLKLDTQGFDLEVIKGAAASLGQIRALQTEASVVPIYADSPNYATTIRTIEEKEFVLSGIFPNNEGHFPRLVEFDCYFIARALSHLKA